MSPETPKTPYHTQWTSAKALAHLQTVTDARRAALARTRGLDALFLLRDDDGNARGIDAGRLFFEVPAAIALAEAE
jgi:thiamine biosynthesis lipoprotein